MRRVTGVGGIFMSAKDPKALCDWYKKHLGIDVQDSTSQSTARGRLQRAREDRRLGVREIRMGHGSRGQQSGTLATATRAMKFGYSPGGPTSNPSLNRTPNSRLRRLSVAG